MTTVTLTKAAERTPFLPVPNRVAFTIPESIPLIGGLQIMWYGVLLTLGIVVAFFVVYKKAPSRKIDPEKVLDYALWIVPFGAIGARLYYVIFEWENYKDDLMSILNFREGGLAIHGALIGGFTVGILCLIKWKQKILDWVDLTIMGIVIAQSIGRWGNYFNSEAHGTATDLPWAIYCDGEFVHPTFLYESIWCFLLFIFLLWFDRKKAKYRGQITCLYAILYSVERFFVEGLRTDSLWIGKFRQAQVISVVFIICGIIGLVLINKYKDKLVIGRPLKAPAEVTANESAVESKGEQE